MLKIERYFANLLHVCDTQTPLTINHSGTLSLKESENKEKGKELEKNDMRKEKKK